MAQCQLAAESEAHGYDDLHSKNSTRIVCGDAACANMNFLRQGFRKLSSDRHDRQTDTKPRRFAGGQWLSKV